MSEAELKEYRLQLESVEAALKADPDNTELQSLVSELHEIIALTETVIAETTGAKPAASSSSNHRPPPISTNSSSSTPGPTVNSPYHSTPTPHTPDIPTAESSSSYPTYAVGDQVHAKWTSGDNAYYPAKITSVLGSTKNPVYLVKFTQYNATEQLSPKDIRPASKSGTKRKLDGSSVTGSGAAGSTSTPGLPIGAVISQPAAINAELAEARKKATPIGGVPGKGEEGPKKKGRKLEQKKVLEAGQKKWQEFAAKGVKGKGKKKIGESSMFRTPESVTGRVGFTGSGQAMRKDAVRGKHIYQRTDDDE